MNALELSDEQLLEVILGHDIAASVVAKHIFDKRHANDPPIKDPPHCAECFEGCPKCQPELFR